MGQVDEGAALKPPGGTDTTPAESSGSSSHCTLVAVHAPSRKGLGAKFEIHPPRYTIGTLQDDLPIEGAGELGTQAQLIWVVDEQATSGGRWCFKGRGSVSINGCPANDHPLRSGDQLRVVDTYFRFLSGDAPPDAYHETLYHMTVLDMPTSAHNRRYLGEAFERDRQRARRRSGALSLGLITVEWTGANVEADERLLRPLVQQLRQGSGSWVTARIGPKELVVVADEPVASLQAELTSRVRSIPRGDTQVTLAVVVAHTADATLEQLLQTARGDLTLLSG